MPIPPLGPLTEHMLTHVLLMNGLAPLLVLAAGRARIATLPGLAASWPLATLAQLCLLWGWHAPIALESAMGDRLLMALMHLSLTVAALWFWAALWAMRETGLWRAIVALLITGKLFCLMGALLVFAPDALYSGLAHAGMGAQGGLADQHAAGLVMLVACPLTYVLAGVVLSARWFAALEARAS